MISFRKRVSTIVCLFSVLYVFSDIASSKPRKHKPSKSSDEDKIYEVLVGRVESKVTTKSMKVGGILKPASVSYLMAYGDGVVQNVLSKPGAVISEGQTILKIEPANSFGDYSSQKIQAKKPGTLLKLNVAQGDFVKKGQTVGLIAGSKIGVIKFSFTGEDKRKMSQIKSSKLVGFESDKQEFKTYIEMVNLMSDEDTLSYTGFVKVECKVSCVPLFGSYVEVDLIENSENMFVVDKRAVDFRTQTVNTVTGDGKVLSKKVQVFETKTNEVYIKSGLNLDDKVILSSNISGWKKLQDGYSVVIKKENVAKKK